MEEELGRGRLKGLSMFRDRVGRKRMAEELGRVRLKGLSV
jgi:hypothetical protein